MASWVQCTGYGEARETIWINFDTVASMTPHDDCTALRFAVSDMDGPFEMVVWESAQDILEKAKG